MARVAQRVRNLAGSRELRCRRQSAGEAVGAHGAGERCYTLTSPGASRCMALRADVGHFVRRPAGTRSVEALRVRLIPIVLALAWGLNWPAVKIALSEFPPFTLRLAGLGTGG